MRRIPKGWLDTPERLQPQSGQQGARMADRQGDEALGDWDISAQRSLPSASDPRRARQIFLRVADAPVGYLASLQNYFDTGKGARAPAMSEPSRNFSPLPTPSSLHFIGKDIIYFHTLFWPAMLKFAGPPTRCPITYMRMASSPCPGEKMSKSRGTASARCAISRSG